MNDIAQGIFVGYRGFEIKNLAPLFPFGYGLSYTSFEYSNLSIHPISALGHFSVEFQIKNTGKVDGREVAQIYVSDPDASLPRPTKELKGFIKANLKSGETGDYKIDLYREALGFYDDRRGEWVAESGTFEVLVGASSADIRLKGEAELKKSFSWTGL